MNLLTAPLESVTFSDVTSWLGLNLPEDRRIPEGVKVDYKDLDIPSDLGDTVAAFSNTSGGLIFIGIKSDKAKGNVPVAWPGIPSAPDLETRIGSRVLSTVRPKPFFEVRTVKVSETNSNVVVVVRVEEGSYPPYEYEQGNTVRIPMRINDLTRQSNVRDIELLLSKRNTGTPLSEQGVAQYINAQGFDCTNPNGIQDLEFHRIVVVPRKPTLIRLDAAAEVQLAGRILKHFPNEKDKNLTFSDRRGEYIQLQSKRTEWPWWHRLWRMYRNGAVAFSGTLSGEFEDGKPIGDLAHNFLSVCLLAREILVENNVQGEVYMGQMIRTQATNLLPQFPEELPLGRYYTSTVFSTPNPKENLRNTAFSFDAIHISDLGQPHEAIAEIMMYNLRELRQIRIDREGFLLCLKQMRGHAL